MFSTNRTKKWFLLSHFLLTLIIFSFFGCNGLINYSTNAINTSSGSLHFDISLPDSINTKTIVPTLEMSVSTYDISGSGPGNALFDSPDVTDKTFTRDNLAIGNWEINVDAKNSSGDVIARGSTAVTIAENEITSAVITVTPLEGPGTIDLTIKWTDSRSEVPSITATLTPLGGTPLIGNFVIADDGLSATYNNSNIDSGYYTLSIQMHDGDNVVDTWVGAVRIISGNTARAVFTLSDGNEISVENGLNIEIEDDLQNPTQIVFSGNYEQLMRGESMTIATTVSESVDTYQWYLNGQKLDGEINKSITIGENLALGKYNLTLFVTKGSVISSDSLSFNVVETPDNLRPAHNAYSVKNLDKNISEDILGGNVIIVKALNETDIAGYNLYWGQSQNEKLTGEDMVQTFPADGTDKTYVFDNIAVPIGATHLLVYSYNEYGESLSPTSNMLVDRVMHLVSDIQSGDDDSYPNNFFEFDGRLYFTANDGIHGRELWVYDEENGASIVSDINAGPTGSNPSHFAEFNGKLYFRADNYTNGAELWSYDGHNDIRMVYDINPGAAHSNAGYLTLFNNNLYFSANDGTHGNELYVYDGEYTPSLVDDTCTGSCGSEPTYLTVLNNILYYASKSYLNAYDGQSAPKQVFHEYNNDPNNASYFIKELIVFNNKLYFSAYETLYGRELHQYDGQNDPVIINIASGSTSSNPEYLTVYNNKLYFTSDGVNIDNEPWFYDGYEPKLLYNINATSSSNPKYYTEYKNKLFFQAMKELYVYDGSDNTIENVYDFGDINIEPSNLKVYNDRLYFSADNGVNGRELWVYYEK